MDKPKKSATNNNNPASKANEGNKKLSVEYYNNITFTSVPGTPQNLLYPIQPTTSGGGGVKIPKDLLDDLASRFIINIPDHERIDMIRVCFQIELAHWFYLDFMLPTNNENAKKLPSCGIKQFTWQIFNHVPFLRPQIGNVDKIIEDWKTYKLSVPTYGAILMSKSDNVDIQVLLVQSFWSKCSFGFPKGKINENEDPVKCAIREVYEETGYDITKLIDPNEYIELYINLQYTRLYLVPNVPNDPETVFEPKTRNEIKCCKWFSVQQLPTNKNESKLHNANSFFMIFPFIKRLKRWLAERQTDKLTVAGNNSPKMFTYSTPDNVNMSVVRRQRHKSQGSVQDSSFGKPVISSSPYQDISITSILGKGNKIKRKLNYDSASKNKQKSNKTLDANHKKFEFNSNVSKMMTDFQFDRLAIIVMAMKT